MNESQFTCLLCYNALHAPNRHSSFDGLILSCDINIGESLISTFTGHVAFSLLSCPAILQLTTLHPSVVSIAHGLLTHLHMVVMDHMAYRNDFPPVSQAPIADNAITTEAVDSIGEVGPHAVQSQDHNADLSDMAFIHMVNNAAHGTGDMLNPWHPNYSVHAGPWNPMAMNNNTQCSTYPTYRPGPFTEPTMQTHHVVDVADHGLSECSSMCSHYHAGPLPSTTIPTVLNTLTPQSIAPGMPAPRRRHSSDISRIRRMSSKSDKLLSPCDICLKQGKGTRIPKNAADQK